MTYRVSDHTTSDDSKAYRLEDAEQVEQWKAKGPIPRWRAYLDSQGAWTAEKQAALEAEAKSDIVAAFKAGEAKKKPPLKDCFTDTYTELPWHLEEQWQAAEKHVREFSGDYNLGRYRGLDGPLPAMDPKLATSGPRTFPPKPTGPTERTTMVAAIN